MSSKSVVPRDLANRDVDDAIAYYLKEHAELAALGLVDALEDAYALLSRHPAIGTSRYAHELDIPGLRSWPLPRFPYVIFYLEQPDRIDVWRVLHSLAVRTRRGAGGERVSGRRPATEPRACSGRVRWPGSLA